MITGHRRTRSRIVSLGAIAALSVACSNGNPAPQAAATATPDLSVLLSAPSTPLAPTAEPDTSVKVPSQVSDLPDGVYRTQLSVKKLHELGIDNMNDGPAGTWTLTVKAGTFEMHCQPIADAATDCGNANLASLKVNGLMEVGKLRGKDRTVWFVDDSERKAKLTGCVAHSEAGGGCGPDLIYHMQWRTVPRGLVFSNYGVGDDPGTSNSMTVQMWTKIS